MCFDLEKIGIQITITSINKYTLIRVIQSSCFKFSDDFDSNLLKISDATRCEVTNDQSERRCKQRFTAMADFIRNV